PAGAWPRRGCDPAWHPRAWTLPWVLPQSTARQITATPRRTKAARQARIPRAPRHPAGPRPTRIFPDMSRRYDLFVIGAGSGGVRAARMSAGFGARVAIAEERYLGGTCVNVGCIPKKLFVYASHFREEFEHSRGFGWEPGEASFRWQTLLENKDREIRRLNGVYERLLRNSGVEIINGRARLLDAHTVEVGGEKYEAERILVATGNWPVIPEFPGRQHVISSNGAFHLREFPRRVIVVGGGYIAVEFAGIFNGLGAKTTLVYRGPLFLRGFDRECREFLAQEMRRKGVELLFDDNIGSVEKTDDGYAVRLKSGAALDADLVMFATGRRPNTADLGL